jgi:hypothetical protein
MTQSPDYRGSYRIPASRYWRRVVLLSSILATLSAASAFAKPTQEEVFRSIQTNVSGDSSSTAAPIFLLVVGGLGVLVLLAYLSKRDRRVAEQRPFHHPGKLLREMRKKMGLKPIEIKQLKLLAEGLGTDEKPGPSPLTLLLCPSVFAKAVQNKNVKIDREVLAGLVKRMKSESPSQV